MSVNANAVLFIVARDNIVSSARNHDLGAVTVVRNSIPYDLVVFG